MAKKGWRTARPWTAAQADAALDRADSSGLSDERFAQREGLNPQRLYYWRGKLGRAKRSIGKKPLLAKAGVSRGGVTLSKGSRPASSGSSRRQATTEGDQFIEVKAVAVDRLEVQLRNGRVVSAPITVAPSMLAALLDAIEGSGC